MNHQMRLTFNNDRNICRSLFGLSKCRREESMQIKIAKKKTIEFIRLPLLTYSRFEYALE